MMRKAWRQTLSLLLCVCMTLPLLPTNAFASGQYDSETSKYENLYYRQDGYIGEARDHITIVGCDDAATTVTIPEEIDELPVTTISSDAFRNHPKLESVVIPNSVTTIENGYKYSSDDVRGAFAGCEKLSSVTLSTSLTELASYSFADCTALQSINLSGLIGLTSIGEKAFYGSGLTSVTFPTGVDSFVSIGEYAFAYSKLSSVTIPDSVTTIDYWAFGGCGETDEDTGALITPSLASVTLGSGVETIGESAFSEAAITSVVLPDSLTSIGQGAFGYCASLTGVTWPNNDSFTEVTGFENCTSLPISVFNAMPDSVTAIGDMAFAGGSFTALTIPARIRTIGDAAFVGCESLASLTILPGTTSIGQRAFYGCNGLAGTTVELPTSIAVLKGGAFGGIDCGSFSYDSTDSDTYFITSGNLADIKPLTLIIRNRDLSLEVENSDSPIYDIEDENFANPINNPVTDTWPVKIYGYAENSAGTQSYLGLLVERLNRGNATIRDYGALYSLSEPEDTSVLHTVSGSLPEGAVVTVRRGSTPVTVTTEGADFSASVLSGADVVVTVSRDGYYDKTYFRADADFTADWSLGTVEIGAALPVSGRMLVELTGATLSSFDGLALTLASGSTVLIAGTDYTVQYPYIIMAVPAAAQELTLTVTPEASLCLAGGSFTATQAEGKFTVALKAWGKLSAAVTGSFAGGDNLLVFDTAGKLVQSGITAANMFVTAQLPAGSYTVVAFNRNALFSSAASLSALTSLGLTQNTDYAKITVTVEDGRTVAAAITVPVLNTGNLTTFIDSGISCVTVEENRVFSGNGSALNVRVFFALKGGEAAGVDDTVTLTIPEGLTLESVCTTELLTKTSDNTYSTGGRQSGVFYLRLKANTAGRYTIGAALTHADATVPIGSADFTARPVYLELDGSRLETRTGHQAIVYAAPGTAVSLYVGANDAPVTGTTNANGRTVITYGLPDNTVAGEVLTLRAAVTGGEATANVTYLPAAASLKKLSFVHAGNSVVVIDAENPLTEKTYYTYVANGMDANNYWSFYAEIEGAAAATDVVLSVEMMGGSVRTVPMTVLSAEQTEGMILSKCAAELYIMPAGNHVFDNSRIPHGFSVDWDRTPADYVPNAARVDAEVQARADARNSAIEAATTAVGSQVPPQNATAGDELKLLLGYDEATASTNPTKAELDTLIAYLTDSNAPAGEQWEAGLSDEATAEATTLFNYGYRVSDESDFAVSSIKEADFYGEENAEDVYAEYKQLCDDFRAAVYALEDLMDQCCDIYTDLLHLPKPIQEYASWEKVFEDMGVTYTPGGTAAPGESFIDLDNNRKFMLGTGGCFSLVDSTANYRLDVDASYFTGGGETQSLSVLMNAVEANDSPRAMLLNNPTDALAGIETEGTTAGIAMTALGLGIDWQTDAVEATIKGRCRMLAKDGLIKNEALRAEIRSEIVSNHHISKRLETSGKVFGAVGNVMSGVQVYSDGDAYCQNVVDLAEQQGELDNLDIQYNFYFNRPGAYDCWEAVKAERAKLQELVNLLKDKSAHLVSNMVVGTGGIIGSLWSGGATAVGSAAYDCASSNATYWRDYAIAGLTQEYQQLKAKRESECGEAKGKLGRKVYAILDPSGIIYEALESNTLSGVTATIYVADDEHGTNAQVWTASDYDQTNPQSTGADGAYAWDVPSGWWQVRFTKAGYTEAQTEWMQVPPPRMNLTTAMVSTDAPTVATANAYPDYIEVIFSQYMDKTASLTLSTGMTGTWQGSETYSKVLHVTKTGGFTLDEPVTLTISGAKNYAGRALAAYNSGALTVSARPAEIVLNYVTTIAMKASETPTVTVRVKDSDGNYMPGVTVEAAVANPLLSTIAANAATDADGKAVFNAEALLPGLTEVSFTVSGTSLKKTLSLRVTADENRPARPTAVVGSTSLTAASPKENYVTVQSGDKLTINAEPGVTIFYTTDDTCPCQNSASRKTYTAPISLTTNAKYRIAAYSDGMEYSERLNITVTIATGGGSIVTPPNVIPPDVWNNPFSDVAESDWFYADVEYAYLNKLFEGTSPTTFAPHTDMTRGMLVTVLYRLGGEPAVTGTNPFDDVASGKYYENAVIWAAANNLVTGYGNSKFGPNDKITREQLAAILYRYAAFTGYDVTATADLTKFSDSGEISTWAETAMSWANANELINGKGDGILDPQGNAERCQVAAILHRFIENVVKQI